MVGRTACKRSQVPLSRSLRLCVLLQPLAKFDDDGDDGDDGDDDDDDDDDGDDNDNDGDGHDHDNDDGWNQKEVPFFS